MTANELADHAVKMADSILKKGEVVLSICYVHVKQGAEQHVVALDYNAAPLSDERELKRGAIIMAIRTFRAAGVFQGAVLVSEAWMKRERPEDKSYKYDRPIAEDPKRVDALIVCAYSADGSRRFKGWELKPTRKKGGRYRAPETIMDSEAGYQTEGWLDEAFHDEHKGQA